MPIDDLSTHALGGLFRLIGYLFTEVIVEILIRGPGYLICRALRWQVDLDSGRVVFIGLLFWILVAAGCFWAFGA